VIYRQFTNSSVCCVLVSIGPSVWQSCRVVYCCLLCIRGIALRYTVIMEKLSEEQRKVISKMNMAALAVKLSRSGVSDDALQHMSREEMLNAWALGGGGPR
jgi:hypothetical protein